MATQIGETISRVRNVIKSVKEDAFLTDRLIYSLIIKWAKMYIKRQENKNGLTKFASLFVTLPCVELVESDRVEACCGVSSGTTIKRTKEKIPGVMEAKFGPLFRIVSSIDGSEELSDTNPSTYLSMTKTSSFKYNKTKYYWFLNGYLYFPDLEWEAVLIDGIFEDNLAKFICTDNPDCAIIQEQQSPIPDSLFAEIEQAVIKDLFSTMAIPQEPNIDDKQGPLRT